MRPSRLQRLTSTLAFPYSPSSSAWSSASCPFASASSQGLAPIYAPPWSPSCLASLPYCLSSSSCDPPSIGGVPQEKQRSSSSDAYHAWFSSGYPSVPWMHLPRQILRETQMKLPRDDVLHALL